jgi:hypothetical protein
MNFVFARERVNIPKYALGINPYVIDVNKILSKMKGTDSPIMINSKIYLMNMILQEEFEFSMRKKKTCIYYVNPHLSHETIKNIKKALLSLGIEVKKYFLVDDDSLKKLHKHVDRVIKPR